MGTEHDEIISRLRTLGHQPVDPGTAGRHISFLGAAAPAPERSRRRPMMVAAMLAGAVLGGTGLAAALPGSLPEQASSVAKSALAAVAGDGHGNSSAAKAAAKAAKEARSAENSSESNMKVGRFLAGCTAGTPPTAFVGTHGQYVKAHPDDPATTDVNERQVAAESDCGKPLSAVEGASQAADDKDAKEDDEGSGKPADAGKPASPGKSDEEHGAASESEDAGEGGKPAEPGKSAEHRPESAGQSGS